MSFSATGGLALLSDAVPVLLYLTLVGLAVRVAFDRGRRLPGGFAVTAGFGLAVSMVCISAGFVLLRRLDLVVVALVLVSVVTVIGSLAAAPGRRARAADLMRALASPADVGAVLAAVAVLAPVSGYANRLFTNGTNDFPSYSASVQVWQGAVGDGPDFTTVHPDAWGALIERRGLTEKPMVTAFMVLISTLSGRYPEQQEAVIFLLLVLIGTGALIALVCGVFGLRWPTATLLVLPATMSSVPLSRLYDAQPGQVALVTLLSVSLVGAHALLAPGRGWLPAVIPSSVALVALIGSNVTLALGLAPTVAALCVAIGLRGGGAFGAILGRAAAWIALTMALSLPFLPLYARSLELQVVGEAGFPVSLAPPLAMVGLEAFDGYGDNTEAVAQWLLAIPLLFWVWRLVATPTVRQSRIVAGTGCVVLANVVVFVGWYGPGSYQTHKWLAVATVFITPLVGAGLVRAWLDGTGRPNTQRSALPGWVMVAMTYCVIAATLLTYQVGVSPIKNVAPGVHALRNDPTLAGVEVVNIALDDIYAAAIAVQAVPTREVILARANGATSAPIGNQFVVASGAGGYLDVQSQQPLNADVDLVTGRLTLPLGRTDLTTANPLTPRYLYGDWYDPQDWGVWARPDGLSGASLLVFDVPDGATGRPLALTMTLRRQGAGPRPLTVRVGERTAATGQFTTQDRLQVSVDLEPGDVRDGRVVLVIDSPGQTPDPDATPPRNVGVGLSAVELVRR